MTKTVRDLMDIAASDFSGDDFMTFDPFDGALWKQKISDQSPDGTVTVTLSTGKKITVNSRLLALLRLLADDLAREETGVH